MIFLSFREGDVEGAARALRDDLAEKYGGENVYYFYRQHAYGENIYAKIQQAMDGTLVVLALVGERWTQGDRVLREDDIVRYELSLGASRGKAILPVRFEIPSLPGSDHLPPDLAWFGQLDSPPLSEERWDYDLSNIVTELDRRLGFERPTLTDKFQPILADAPWWGQRTRATNHSILPFETGEKILLTNAYAKVTVRKPGFAKVYRSLVHVTLTSRAMYMVHMGQTDEEIRQFQSGQRESELWILPYDQMTKLTWNRRDSTLPGAVIRITYGSPGKNLTLIDVSPKGIIDRIVSIIQGIAPALQQPLWKRFLT